MTNHWWKLVSLLVVAVFVFLFSRWKYASLLLRGDLEGLQEAAGERLLTILPLTFLVMLVHNLIPVIPLVFVVTLNITMLGFVPGYFWSLATSVLCATLAFAVVRFWLQNPLSGKISPKLMKKIEDNGFWVVFVSRMFPYVPSSVMNAAAGISTIGFKTFALSTTAGNAIFILAVSLISFGALTVSIELAAFLILLLAGAAFAANRWLGKSKKRQDA